jgi:hypothetical protein
MQERLFDIGGDRLDHPLDPYKEDRAVAVRIASAYGIPVEEAFDLLLAFGSEGAVRRVLKQRWWRGEIDRLDEEAA